MICKNAAFLPIFLPSFSSPRKRLCSIGFAAHDSAFIHHFSIALRFQQSTRYCVMYHFWLHFFYHFLYFLFIFLLSRWAVDATFFYLLSYRAFTWPLFAISMVQRFSDQHKKDDIFFLSTDPTFVCIGHLVLISFVFSPFAFCSCILFPVLLILNFIFGIGPCSFCLFGSCFHVSRNLVIGVRVYLLPTKNRKSVRGCLFFYFTFFCFSFNAL